MDKRLKLKHGDLPPKENHFAFDITNKADGAYSFLGETNTMSLDALFDHTSYDESL
jgi:hypothetical protein